MNEMEERVAKAIYDSHRFVKSWESNKGVWAPVCLEQARAAIAAMLQEPTGPVCKAGAGVLRDFEDITGYEMRASLAFRAMIEEMLS